MVSGIALGIVADRILGEPPAAAHPVVAFGKVMRAVERTMYRDTRTAGAVHAVIGTGLGATAGAVLRSTAVATWLAVAGRALASAATGVGAALEAGDLDRARSLLPALVGRDPSQLDEKEIARAVVESVAENTVDAVVAPAFWAAVLGARGALGYRAVNTLDAMVGHHSPRYEHYGWASARLDDLAGWVPARMTAAAVAAVRPRAAGAVWTAVRTQAPAHPSPNAGVAEAAFAAALGLRLGGENRYCEPGGSGARTQRVEIRPPLGTGRPAEAADIARAVALSRDVGASVVVISAISGRITTRNAPR
jgi:adenosylcobinamide-phosphate synthase